MVITTITTCSEYDRFFLSQNKIRKCPRFVSFRLKRENEGEKGMAELYDHEFLSTEFPHDVMFACDGFDSESSHVGIQGSMAVQHNHTTPTTATAAAHRCTKTQKNNNDDDDERMCGRCRCCCRNIQKLDGDWNRSYPTWYIIKRGRLFPLCAALIRFVLLCCVLDVRASCGPCLSCIGCVEVLLFVRCRS